MNENKELTLSLTINEWNRIRNAMGEVPYKNISDLFSKMDKQFDKQLKQPIPEEIKEEK